MKCFYSNSFIKLDSFYDQPIEVTLSESMQGFSTKDIFQQKPLFIISYIYQKTIVKGNCSYCQQKVLFVIELDLVESYVYYAFVKLYFLELHFKAFIRIFYTVAVLYLPEMCLFIYLFNLLMYCIDLSDIYQKYIYQKFIRLYF